MLRDKKNWHFAFVNLDDDGGGQFGDADEIFLQDTNRHIFFDKIGSIYDVRRDKKNDTFHLLTWMITGGVTIGDPEDYFSSRF